MKIPFVDLKAQYASIKKEIDVSIQSVIDETAFIKGKYVEEFELKFKEAYGAKNFVSCANGTDAIYIALKAMGIGPGDEVITTALSWISTSETITLTGAKVVFVDIDKEYYTIDVTEIENKITNKTKAIIPVHLYGQSANMSEIMKVAKKYSLKVIEDCAQAHFAQWKGENVGAIGHAGTFSFFPGKNLGAYGDAGGIITNDSRLAKKMRMIANHGAITKHDHKTEGINSRLDGMQAAILNVKLQYIQNWTSQRIELANYYIEALKDVNDISVPMIDARCKHVFHLFVIQVKNRKLLQKELILKGIANAIHYPVPLPFMEAYKYLGNSRKDFPNVNKISNKILSLPIYPELTKNNIDYIVNTIRKFYMDYV